MPAFKLSQNCSTCQINKTICELLGQSTLKTNLFPTYAVFQYLTINI